MYALPPISWETRFAAYQRNSVAETLRFDRVVGDPGVDHARGQIGHGLQAEQVRDHPRDLLLDQLEVG
jgi:hypothetical protein